MKWPTFLWLAVANCVLFSLPLGVGNLLTLPILGFYVVVYAPSAPRRVALLVGLITGLLLFSSYVFGFNPLLSRLPVNRYPEDHLKWLAIVGASLSILSVALLFFSTLIIAWLVERTGFSVYLDQFKPDFTSTVGKILVGIGILLLLSFVIRVIGHGSPVL